MTIPPDVVLTFSYIRGYFVTALFSGPVRTAPMYFEGLKLRGNICLTLAQPAELRGKVIAIILYMKKAGPFPDRRKTDLLVLLFDFWGLTSMDIYGKRSFETEGQNAPKPAWLLRKLG